ncbi:hypothetical protein [Pseudomonas sp. MWU16-30323]|uniref:hypothetical protein n=1 Tax=Pseudomonas sp. MWU16-30323 TaxID=2878094 RepID=UPI001CF9B430|nr:hypothetical protein [Pseudomonas sp. MWU16-30323]
MSSVNHPQTAPYTRGYEMTPTPVPIRREESAEAQPDHPPSTPRKPITSQERGEFSAHRQLVNTTPPSTPKQGDTEQLARLARENDKLRGEIKQLVDKFTPVIQRLQKEVAHLTQQYNASTQSGTGTSPRVSTQAPSKGESRSAAPPQTSPTNANTRAPAPYTSPTPETLAKDNKELRQEIDTLTKQFDTLVDQLQQQINDLTRKLSNTGKPENRNASSAQNVNTAPKEGNHGADNNSSVASTQPKAPTTIETLTRENEQLRAAFEQMMTEFKTVIAQLQQQIKELTNKLGEQKA